MDALAELHERDRRLMRAWLAGALSTRAYAWLYVSLWRHGRQWRWN